MKCFNRCKSYLTTKQTDEYFIKEAHALFLWRLSEVMFFFQAVGKSRDRGLENYRNGEFFIYIAAI